MKYIRCRPINHLTPCVSLSQSTSLSSTTLPSVLQEKRYVKKHLFSDMDYSTTDVSWLKESCRKPKPKVTKYSRQAPDKPRPLSLHTSCRPLNSHKHAAHNLEFLSFTAGCSYFKTKCKALSIYTDESPDQPPASRKPVKGNTKLSKVQKYSF